MKAVKHANGWLIVDDYGVVQGPFDSYQDLCDFYIRMDYDYENKPK